MTTFWQKKMPPACANGIFHTIIYEKIDFTATIKATVI
jgi:hypothetical protein